MKNLCKRGKYRIEEYLPNHQIFTQKNEMCFSKNKNFNVAKIYSKQIFECSYSRLESEIQNNINSPTVDHIANIPLVQTQTEEIEIGFFEQPAAPRMCSAWKFILFLTNK